MHIPQATYRLQVNHQFNFANASKILPYLKALGISDIYISPILQARPNSMHGYDVIDYQTVNKELGGEAGFKQFTQQLRRLNLHLILDLVPNHMAATQENRYWADVLQQGIKSPHQSLFDVNWAESNTDRLVYRRFIDVDQLICLRMEDPQVFAETHGLILRLIAEGDIQGLRIDHIDGLREPLGYLQRLNHALQLTGKKQYVVVEKIMTYGETLPQAWPIAGTTGYDFLTNLNLIFIEPAGLAQLMHDYIVMTGDTNNLSAVITRAATKIIELSFLTEFKRLLLGLHSLMGGALTDLQTLLWSLSINVHRYRCYSNLKDNDEMHAYLSELLQQLRQQHPQYAQQIDLLTQILFLDFPRNLSDDQRQLWQKWHIDWENYTVAVYAKSFEDTACYAYNPLLSMNEVGMSAKHYLFAGQLEAFHQINQQRQATWPHSMNATSTHDTKRSEDVRARLNVLTELSQSWQQCLKSWFTQNETKKTLLSTDIIAPDTIDEIFIYQTLLSIWPLSPSTSPTQCSKFKTRLKTYFIKAMRERKQFSTWHEPNPLYEAAVQQFIERLLDDEVFLNDFLSFQPQIAFYGMHNSLVQMVLKMTCPGVPDFYQGNETWRFDLVDPDNRQVIDFAALIQLNSDKSLAHLLRRWQTGEIKFNLIKQLLHLRQNNKDLWAYGDYLPLMVVGPHAKHIIAFARIYQQQWFIIVAARWLVQYVAPDEIWHSKWLDDNDYVLLPNRLQQPQSLLAQISSLCLEEKMAVKQLLGDLPFNIVMTSLI